jgi:hypothetical protein
VRMEKPRCVRLLLLPDPKKGFAKDCLGRIARTDDDGAAAAAAAAARQAVASCARMGEASVGGCSLPLCVVGVTRHTGCRCCRSPFFSRHTVSSVKSRDRQPFRVVLSQRKRVPGVWTELQLPELRRLQQQPSLTNKPGVSPPAAPRSRASAMKAASPPRAQGTYE